jgi:hypothetical protein
MAYYHVYQGSVTEGGTNGTQVSEDTESSPISVTLNATNNEESSSITLAIRCETGYNTTGNTSITPTGTSASKWCLSNDGTNWGTYGSALTISSTIGTTNTLFYAKAKAVDTETPVNDTTVNLVCSATIQAV